MTGLNFPFSALSLPVRPDQPAYRVPPTHRVWQHGGKDQWVWALDVREPHPTTLALRLLTMLGAAISVEDALAPFPDGWRIGLGHTPISTILARRPAYSPEELCAALDLDFARFVAEALPTTSSFWDLDEPMRGHVADAVKATLKGQAPGTQGQELLETVFSYLLDHAPGASRREDLTYAVGGFMRSMHNALGWADEYCTVQRLSQAWATACERHASRLTVTPPLDAAKSA